MRLKYKDPTGLRQRPALRRISIQVGDQVSQVDKIIIQPTGTSQEGLLIQVNWYQWIVASFSFKYLQLLKMHKSSCACVILFLLCVIIWLILNWLVTQLNKAVFSKVKHVAIIQTESMWWKTVVHGCETSKVNQTKVQNTDIKITFISSCLKIDLSARSDVHVNLKCFGCCFTLLTLFCQQQGGNNDFHIFRVQQVNSSSCPSALTQQMGAGRLSGQGQTRSDPCATPTARWHFPRGFTGRSIRARVSPGAQQGARPSSVAGGVPTWRVTFPLLRQQLLDPGDLPQPFILQVRGFWHNQRVNGWHTYTQTETSPAAAHTQTYTRSSPAVIRLTVVVLVVAPLCELTLRRWLMPPM